MAYSSITKPSNFFNTKLYAGNGNAGNAQTGVGFQPDFVWLKSRTNTEYHNLYDAVRGVTKRLVSNTTGAESTISGLTAFGTDGFTVGAADTANQNSQNFVAWNWKAGTTAIPSGSTTDPLGVSINTTSGFGIYKITSPGSGSYVLKHGLGKKPKMVIVKDLEATQKWMVWSDTFSNATNDYIKLNSTDAKLTYSTCWGTMNSTDCTISVGGTLDANNDHVVYIFTDTTGYFKHGSYVGNGSANGTFIYTGFKPAFVMLKNTTTAASWLMYDNKRLGYNVDNNELVANTADDEETYDQIDILSNGFKMRANGTSTNKSGDTFIYMAFADNPFVASNYNVATAR